MQRVVFFHLLGFLALAGAGAVCGADKAPPNFIIVFTSDNGPWVEPRQFPIEHSGSADPLRGYKMQTWEGGPRVPFAARWPGGIPPGQVSDELVSSLDIMPSFLKVAGVDLPEGWVIDGVEVMPLLKGETDKSPRDTFFYYNFVHLQAVRHGPWKLVLPRPARPRWRSWGARMVDAVPNAQLYHLPSDIAEERNVASEHPDVVSELMELAEAARAELGDYDRVGSGARFFDEAPKRGESRQWIVRN